MNPADIAEQMEHDAMFDRKARELAMKPLEDQMAELKAALEWESGLPWGLALNMYREWKQEREMEIREERM